MKKQPVRSPWLGAAVFIVTIIALIFRIWGIRWGLPDVLHDFTYHPDEIFQVGAMLRVNPFAFEFDPGFYSYPSGYMNLGAIVLRIATQYGMAVDESLTGIYLTARLVVVALGTLAIPVAYGAAKRLYGRAAGILAALILAITPLHIVHSHFATVDVPAAFWTAVTIFAASVIISKPVAKWYIIAGLAAGFAAGTKYNAAIVFLPVLVAHFLRPETGRFLRKIGDGRLWAAVGAFFAGFIISTPAILTAPGKYMDGFLYELRHAGSGHGLVFQDKGPGWFDVMVNSLGYGLGVFLLVMALAAVGMAIVRRKPGDWLVLSFVVPYYAMVSFSEVRFARYVILILPPLAMLVGRMMAEVYQVARDQGGTALKWSWVAICMAVLFYTGIYAAALDRLFILPDPRTQAAEWFHSNVEPSATISFPTVPWFYSPPLSAGTTAINRIDRFRGTQESDYKIIVNSDPNEEWDASIIKSRKPDYVVMSDFEYEDVLRLKVKKATEYMDALGVSYIMETEFHNRLSVFGIDFGPTEDLPHDLKYMAPTIRVYRRK